MTFFSRLTNQWFKKKTPTSAALPVPTDAVCLEDRVLYSAVPFDVPAEPVDWSNADELAQLSLDAQDLEQLEFVQPGEPAATLSLIETLIQDYESVGLVSSPAEMADQAQNLVFINYDVDELDQLVADFSGRGSAYQVFVLDGQSDGVEQITNILENYSDLASVHLISHGSNGQVNLGNSALSLASLDQHQDQLASWQNHLSLDADILFYGCELAATEDGQQLIDSFAELTGADIAASDDLTGHDSLGGDWLLEYAVGEVSSDLIVSEQAMQNWVGVLSATETGSVIDVNTFTTDAQETNNTGGQAVATNDAGVSVVVWQSKKQDVPAAGDYGVFAQILDINGNPIGSEIPVNDFVNKDQMSPAVSIADDGSFVVVWTSENQDGDGFGIYGMRFDALGNRLDVPGQPVGTYEFLINSYISGNQIDPAVAMDATGNFVVTWTSDDDQAGANSRSDIFFRRYDAAGNALDATEVLVNTQISFDQYDSSVDMNDTGQFVVSWTASGNQDGDGLGVYAQAFAANGTTVGSEIIVNSETDNDQYDAVVAIADSGDFVVVWTGQNHSLDGSNDGIIAQLFASNTSRIGGEILVNGGNTAGNQATAAVDMMADGQFVVTWTDVGPKLLYYQEFSAAGTPQDQVIQVDTVDTVDQRNSSIAIRDNGDFIVVWTADGSLAFDDKGVFAQQFAFDNEAPSVDLPGTPLTYFENDPPLIIDAAAVVTDVDSANFGGGRLIVDFLVGGTVNDRLAINHEGTGAGEIGVAGSNLTYGGLLIGTFTGGTGSAPLVITLNSNATVAAVEALAQNITYQDLPNDPDTSDRTVRFVLHDGDGGTSDPVTQIISITLVNDAPDIQGITAKVITEDNTIQFQNADLISITDVDAETSELRVTMSVTHGVINLNTTNNLTFYEGTADGESYLEFSGDLAAINNALDGMEYDPTPLYVGTDQLVIHLDDQGNTGAGGALTDDHLVDITINADAVNDAPRNIKPANQTIIEDDQLVFSVENGNQLWIQDDSGAASIRVTLKILNGGFPSTDATLTLADPGLLTFFEGNGVDDSRMVFTGTLDDINAALDGLLFEPNSGFTGQLEISIFTEDLGAQGSGGAQTDTDEIRVDVDERNDPPVITAPGNAGLTEGTPFVFNGGNAITIADPDATGDIQISLDVSHGILSLGTTAGLNFVNGADDTASMTIKGSQAEIAAALTNLTYTPDTNFAGPDNLQITVNDLGGVGAGGAQVDANTIELTINPDATNTDPINTVPADQNTAEETSIEFSIRNGNNISITDDAGTDQIQVTIEVNGGTLTLSNTVGSEFDINNFVAGDQESPQVAIDEDGNYIVVWESNGQDGSGTGIYAQLFNSEGISTGPEFLVNESTAGHQLEPSVDMDRNGNFVIVWTGKGDAGADSKAVYARLFDANGNDLRGGEILVNQTTAGDQTSPVVAMNWQTGDFIVSWQSKDQIDEWDIFARQFSFDLLTIGSEFQVNDTTTKKQTDPSIDINDSGDFIVGWTSNVLGDGNLEVLYRRFDSTGTVIDLVDETASDNSTKNQRNTSVAIDNNGNYVVAWESQDQDYTDDKYGIYAQIWDNTGAEIQNEFVVNDTLPKDQINADVSMDGDGNFIITWESESSENGVDSEVFAKRFDITGTAQGDEFLVNLTAAKDQGSPSVALNPDGEFVVVWQSKGQDAGDSQGIYGQQYRDFNSLNFIEGDGVDDARIVFEGTLDQINDVLDGLVYTPDADFVGIDTLTITTDDQHATDPRSDVDSFDINVGPVNDAPDISVPGLQTITQDNSLTFNVGINEISISDVDAGTTVQDVTIIANHGVVTLFNFGGLASLTGNGTDLVTLSGTLANINAALDGMQFDPNSGFAGSASIFLRVDDPGEPVVGDELSDADTIFIQVDADGVNNAPEIELPNPQRTDKNVELFLDTETGNLISINDDAGSGIIEVSLTVTNGTITLSDGASGDVQEYLVQTGNQTNPDVGAFADGSYVLVWESPNQDGNGTGIVGQRFSSEGLAMGDEFLVNSFVTGNQVNASVATSANGNFVVTWQSPQDGAGLGVYGQLFDNSGLAIGNEFIINSNTASDQELVDVAMADDGSFVAVWQSGGNLDGNGDGIFGQRFDANGVTLGDEFVVNTTVVGNQTLPAIAMSGATGDFLVVWQDNDNNGEGIFAQRFNSDGSTNGNQFLVNTTTLGDQMSPAVAIDDAGNFVITWESVNEDGSGRAVVARLYDNLGQPQGSGFIVNDFVAGDQEAPAVAMNGATGEFVITWQSANQDGDGDAVVGQRFDAAGNQVGSEFVVNSDPTGNQTAPAVSMNSSGEIVAVFIGDDINGDGVFVKKMLPNNAIQFIAGDGINDTFITIRGSLENINAALDGLRFDPNTDFEGVATVSITVDDLGNTGSGGPLVDGEVLNIIVGTGPSIDLDADNSNGSGSDYEALFIIGRNPVAIADVDAVFAIDGNPATDTFDSLTVTLTNISDPTFEILNADTSGTSIALGYDNLTGVLTLTGPDTVDNYQQVLRTITYENQAATPNAGTRIISFVADDGTDMTNVANAAVEVADFEGLWLSTDDDVTGSGVDSESNWNDSTLLEFGGLDLNLGNNTDGTVSSQFDIDAFTGDANLSSLHYVQNTVTIGTGTQVTLEAGDIVFSVDKADWFTSSNSVWVDKYDLVRFRPDTPGDYSVGTFELVLVSPLSWDIQGLAIIESTTVFADTTLNAGQILMVDKNSENIWVYSTVNAGTSSTGSVQLFVDGTELGIDQAIYGLDFVESATQVGGQTLSAGNLLITMKNADNVGGTTYQSQDIFVVNLSTTNLGSGTAAGTASMFFDGSDVGMDPLDSAESIDAISLFGGPSDSPYDIDLSSSSVDENIDTSSGYSVGTLTTSDPDGADTFTYTIVGGADMAKFTIGGGSNDELVLTDGVLNFEAKSSYTVNIEVEDSTGNTYIETVTVDVNDLNEAPVITSDSGGATAAINVAENSTAVTFVTASDEDLPADTLTYTITGGADAALFTLNSSTGELEFVSGQDLETFADADSDGVYEVQVTVDDGNSLNDVQDISVTVTDANEAPVITSDGGGPTAAINVVENTTAVADVDATDEDLPGDTLTYNITGGADQPLFNIDSGSGVLTFATARDFETFTDADSNGIYEVQVTVDDGNGNTDVQTISVTVVDAYILDEFNAIQYAGNDGTVDWVGNWIESDTAGGGTSGGSIHVLGGASDLLRVFADTNDDNIYRVADLSSAVSATLSFDRTNFFVGPGEIVVEIRTGSGSWTVLQTFDSGNGGTNLESFDISSHLAADTQVRFRVANTDPGSGVRFDNVRIDFEGGSANGPPMITSDGGGVTAAINVAENLTAVTTATATDPEFDTLTYSLSGGADQTLFNIDSGTGILTFAAARDFETFTDADSNGIYEVQVTVDDGNGNTDVQDISVTITDANEAPIITSDGGGTTAAFNVAENTTAVTFVTASDEDLPADTLTYTITGGADAALFTLNSSTGELEFDTAKDFETFADANSNGVYEVQVTVDDGNSLNDVQDISVTITDANEAPVITSNGGGTTAAFNVAENSTAVTFVTATDEDLPADTLTYSISGGADAGQFAINSTSGDLTFVAGQDFESASDANLDGIYEVEVTVDDGNFGTDVQTINVTIADANDLPDITSDGGGAVASINVVENTTAVTTVTATDQDPTDILSFNISGGADAALFTINSLSGQLDFVSGQNFESFADADSNGVYEVEVTVGDGNGGAGVQTISVTIVDGNEVPVIVNNGGGSAAAINVLENTTAVTTVVASDPDLPGDTLTYNITGGADAALFAINSSSGDLTFVSARDFETFTDFDLDGVYDVQVTVDDGNLLTDTQDISVTILNDNENPVITSDGGGATALLAVAENTTAITTVVAGDVDAGDTLSYSLSGGADAAQFAINSSTGELSFISPKDFEAPSDAGADNNYQVVVSVDDGNGGSDSQAIDVSVVDGNETPATSGIADLTVDEDSADWNFDLHSAFADPEDLDTDLVYTIENQSNPGLLSSANINPLDEIVLDFADDQNGFTLITVRATDTGGLFVETTFRVDVNPVNDDPTVVSAIGPVVVSEDAGDSVIDLSTVFDDVDIVTNADSLTYSLVSNTDAVLVSATFGGDDLTLDYGDNQFGSATITISATDSFGRSVNEIINLTVNSIQDPTVVDDDVLAPTLGDPVTIDPATLLANDFDADSTSFVVNLDPGSEVGGVVTVDGSGNLVFTPDPTFLGTASFRYIVIADGLTSSPGTVFIDVVTPAPPPTTPDPTPDPSDDSDDDDSDDLIPPTVTANTNTADELPGANSTFAVEQIFSPVLELSDGTNDEPVKLTETAQANFNFATVDMRNNIDDTGKFTGNPWGGQNFATMAGWLWSDLNDLQERMSAEGDLASFWSVATPSFTATISVGYAMWLIKGGQIVAGLMAQVPAWKLIAIDPLPILRSVDEEEEVEGDSLASMVDDAASDDASRNSDAGLSSTDSNGSHAIESLETVSPWDR